MGWVNGLLIQSGYLAGDYIDVNNYIPEVQQGYARNSIDISISRSTQGVDDDFINPYIDTQYDVSEYFASDAPDYIDEELASIAIKDENGITGYICTYITKSTGSPSEVNIHTKFKNSSGVILGQADGIARIYIQNTLAYTYFDPPKVYFSISMGTYNDHIMFSMALNMVQVSHYGGGLYCNSSWAGLIQDLTMLERQWGISGAVDDEKKIVSPEFGPASEPGGGYVPGGGHKPNGGQPKKPTFDNTSDLIPLPSKPQLSALDSIFFHAYKVTKTSMRYIADALFPQPIWTQNDLIMMMGEIGQMLFFNKQIDYMLDALILPIDVPAGDWEHIRVGGHELKTVIEGTEYWINGMPVEDPYVDFPCGSLSIDEYWVNFLDFAGTKVKLFLPYVGYVDIQPEYVIGGTLYVDYRFNVIDGSFMCYVRSDSGYSELEESMIGQYAGVAAVHIPLQSLDYSNKISGLISAIGSVAAGAASGGIGAALGVGAGANAANTIVQKPGSSHANGYNASSSFLSNKTPYLIIERQWGQFSEKYPDEVGLPSNVKCRIGDLSGLVKSENAHLDTIPCSAEMKDKISSLLADGIIVG